ncbi:MAG: sulfate ABC transporter ATP-binding protein [Candidatus Hydrogenedentes bacterium]|nr:sulfate ABC transporter ATP-binding protein [Candidatus Hydrogenedentota bacterium]
MKIEVKDISKTFGNYRALDHISLEVEEGELLALLGPSGCGKTTLLRVIAGLELPDPVPGSGVFFGGENMLNYSVRQRQVGFVFQHYALFRHMTVSQNIAFGLFVRARKIRPSKKSIQGKVHDLLDLIQMESLEHHYPAQLSGGQRQRVALARALAVEPRVLLLDEPFGALDANIRKELRQWLRRLHDEIHVTSVFVTHDQEEALEVADRVVVMDHGRIEQIGTPEEVYHHPANATVCRFIGDINLFHGRISSDGVVVSPSSGAGETEDKLQPLYVRPHGLKLATEEPAHYNFRATVIDVFPARSLVKVALKTEWGATVWAELPHQEYRELDLKPGHTVFVVVEQFKQFDAMSRRD